MTRDFHSYNLHIKGANKYKDIGIAGGNAMLKIKEVKRRGVRFNTSLGYKGGLLLSGEDNEFFDNLVKGTDWRGFTEFAPIIHYIPEEKMKFNWFLKRYFYEGVTQYYRFGFKIYFKYLLQFPLRILRFLIVLFTFNKKAIAERFFKVVMNAGVLLAPIVIFLSGIK